MFHMKQYYTQTTVLHFLLVEKDSRLYRLSDYHEGCYLGARFESVSAM